MPSRPDDFTQPLPEVPGDAEPTRMPSAGRAAGIPAMMARTPAGQDDGTSQVGPGQRQFPR